MNEITEFHIPAGKIYLSPIIDCFDGLPVSWTIGTSPDAELFNRMLDKAISALKEGEHPIIHSDRGSRYRWPDWIERVEKAQLTRFMSKKGSSPDNSACEDFFGRLKNEMFYNRLWTGITRLYGFISGDLVAPPPRNIHTITPFLVEKVCSLFQLFQLA